jgi:magnesium-transporting ATPase (P-type)
MHPEAYGGPLSVFRTIWRNRFLFYAATAGFVIQFPVIYLPVINREVFKHGGITWEWGLVFASLVVYILVVESWKAIKRKLGVGKAKDAVTDDAGSVV